MASVSKYGKGKWRCFIYYYVNNKRIPVKPIPVVEARTKKKPKE